MEPIGWFLFIVSNAIVISLVSFCFYRVLTIPKEHMRAPLDIDTRDRDEDTDNNNDDDDIYPSNGPEK